MKKITVISLACLLAACGTESKSTDAAVIDAPQSVQSSTNYPAAVSIRKQLSCLPKEAAFTAAHRGTSKKEDLPENSGNSLKAVIERGILVAEIDVAGLKDGTLVLFHDGVWEDKTTGKGAVAATNWSEAEKFLLKDTDGDLSADRLITLEDALALAKDTLYLEVDFKSSAKYGDVIKMIRAADMADQVILIAYNERQARKLASLAPEMMMSVSASSAQDIAALESIGVKKENMAIWLGRGPYEDRFVDYLDGQDIPVLAWPEEGAPRQAAASPAALMVTDYALQKKSIEGLSDAGRADYEACLTK